MVHEEKNLLVDKIALHAIAFPAVISTVVAQSAMNRRPVALVANLVYGRGW